METKFLLTTTSKVHHPGLATVSAELWLIVIENETENDARYEVRMFIENTAVKTTTTGSRSEADSIANDFVTKPLMEI